jgi:hypothetical protein
MTTDVINTDIAKAKVKLNDRYKKINKLTGLHFIKDVSCCPFISCTIIIMFILTLFLLSMIGLVYLSRKSVYNDITLHTCSAEITTNGITVFDYDTLQQIHYYDVNIVLKYETQETSVHMERILASGYTDDYKNSLKAKNIIKDDYVKCFDKDSKLYIFDPDDYDSTNYLGITTYTLLGTTGLTLIISILYTLFICGSYCVFYTTDSIYQKNKEDIIELEEMKKTLKSQVQIDIDFFRAKN